MIKINNLTNNDNIRIVDKKEGIMIIEYIKDLSVTEATAINAYYASKMNVHKRQVLITLNNDSYTISQGAMQWMAGNVKASADV